MANIIDLKKRAGPEVVDLDSHPTNSRTNSHIPESGEDVLAREDGIESLPLEEDTTGPMMEIQLADAPAELSWSADIDHRVHGKQEKYLYGLIGAAGLASWFIQRDYLLLVFLVLAGVVIYVYQRRLPRSVPVTLAGADIHVAGYRVQLKNAKSFWIDYNPDGVKELSLEMKHWYSPYVKVPLGQQDPSELHAVLSAYLPEEEHRVSVIDAFLKRG